MPFMARVGVMPVIVEPGPNKGVSLDGSGFIAFALRCTGPSGCSLRPCCTYFKVAVDSAHQRCWPFRRVPTALALQLSGSA
jgi:hypothetical protein